MTFNDGNQKWRWYFGWGSFPTLFKKYHTVSHGLALTLVLNCPLNKRGKATVELRYFPNLPPASLTESPVQSFLGHSFPCQAEKVFISALTLVENLRVFSWASKMAEFLLWDCQNWSSETETPAQLLLQTAKGFDVLFTASVSPTLTAGENILKTLQSSRAPWVFPRGDISTDRAGRGKREPMPVPPPMQGFISDPSVIRFLHALSWLFSSGAPSSLKTLQPPYTPPLFFVNQFFPLYK